MGVSEPFIRRPIATSLLGIALLIGGALGYWALPVSALPQVDFPTVQVTTQLPGAKSRCSCVVAHRTAGASARTDTLTVVDGIDEFVRR